MGNVCEVSVSVRSGIWSEGSLLTQTVDEVAARWSCGVSFPFDPCRD